MERLSPSYSLPITLDRGEKMPLYRQLYEWLRRAIVSGHLRPGQRLPSTRGLASELKISRIPVLSAFEQLHAEGYLQTFVGAGTCVAGSIPDQDSRLPAIHRRNSAAQKRSRKISRCALKLMSMNYELRPGRTDLLQVSRPALDHFPTKVWSSLLSRHSRSTASNMLTYGEPMGFAPFREAVADYLNTVRGVACDASQVMVVTGSQQGLSMTARALLDVGDSIWMEEPGYPGAQRAFVMAGLDVIPVPIDHEGLNVAEGVRRCRDARAAYITPSHQYPMGVTMGATRRMLLLDWAARVGAWIIEDDYDSEFRFDGHPIPSLQGLDANARVIYIGTLSKVLFPASRLGYIVIPKDLIPAFRAVRDATDLFSSTLFQAAMADFVREGHFARHIRKMRMLYMGRRSALTEAIRDHVGHKLELVGAEAGMHLTGLLPPGLKDTIISNKAAGAGVAAIPLSSCYLGRTSRGGLILGYGSTNVEQIHLGVRRLAKIIKAA